MNCWHCNTELIWGGDHDCEDSVEWLIVSNLHCPNCQSHVDVYFPRDEGEEEDDEYRRTTTYSPSKGSYII